MEYGPTILVVDDDPALRRLISLTLVDHGFHVVTADDGVDALPIACGRAPDAIVLDLEMRVMNGDRFLQELRRALPDQPLPPVLILSGHPPGGGVDGAIEVMTKPFDTEDLVRHLSALVNEH